MWLAKLKRMMDELPDKYLEPLPLALQDKLLLPPDAKPVGQITDEERRLFGVCRQLKDAMVLEAEAHHALHVENKEHPPELCERFHRDMEYRQQEVAIVIGNLMLSMKERFGKEREYMIDSEDVYAVPEQPMLLPIIIPPGPMREN